MINTHGLVHGLGLRLSLFPRLQTPIEVVFGQRRSPPPFFLTRGPLGLRVEFFRKDWWSPSLGMGFPPFPEWF